MSLFGEDPLVTQLKAEIAYLREQLLERDKTIASLIDPRVYALRYKQPAPLLKAQQAPPATTDQPTDLKLVIGDGKSKKGPMLRTREEIEKEFVG